MKPTIKSSLPSLSAAPFGRVVVFVLIALVSFILPRTVIAGGSAGWGTNIQTGPQDVADFGRNGMNFKTIRSDGRASIIEPNEGEFRWESTDARYNELLAAGCDILAVVNGNFPPAWMRATKADGTQSTIRPDKDKYAQYVLDFITHYNTGPYASPNNVKHFEIGNEADGMWRSDFANDRETADAYFEVLRSVWERTADFRAAHPEVKLIGGVIAGAPVSLRASTTNYFDQLWTVRGAWQYMDILSFHFYIRRGPPETYYAPELGDPGKGRLWDQVLMPSLAKISDHPIALWATETGYNLDDLAHPSGVQLTEQEHAKWLVRASIIIRGAGVDRFLQFACYANSASPGNYGFRDGVGGAKRESYDAYGTMCKVLDDAVTSIAMKDYYRITSPTTDHCTFEYQKAHGAYGWATWWVPNGTNGISGTITLGDGAIPADAAIYSRSMSGASWMPVANSGTGSVEVTVTDEPLYIEVRPAGTQLAPVFPAVSFAFREAVAGIAYSGSLGDAVVDPDYGLLLFEMVSGPAWLVLADDGTLSGTPTSGDVGINAFEVQATNEAGASAIALLQIDVKETSSGTPLGSYTFISPSSNDNGFVVESAAGSGVGGAVGVIGPGPNALRAGDDASNRQYRSILTFDTAALPDAATVFAATLRVRRGALAGKNPFTDWTPAPSCVVDIKSGALGTSAGLQAMDFQAAADLDAAGFLSNAPADGDWSEASLIDGLDFLNLAGITQFRLRLTTATNGDGIEDSIRWRAGKDPVEENRPELFVRFTKGTAGLTVAPLFASYDGLPKPVSATTTPTGLPSTITYDGSPTPPTNVGTYVVNVSIDDSGYTGAAAGLLVIADTTPPVLTLPVDIELEASGPSGAVATYTATAVDDVDGSVPVSFTPASGSTFPIGVTTVTASATDAAGNAATVSFRVTVRDTISPVFESLAASPAVLWPPNQKMVTVNLTANVSDVADPSPVTRIISVTSNEAIDDSDWEITGPLTLKLRAERSGSGSGRIYTITVESRDQSGNASTETVLVTVPHDQRPQFSALWFFMQILRRFAFLCG
ncbi:MAG: HYR domain-containing protein [Opitutaceae bacterium]|nr:HYR domain-containing protein [Opitutaceae bacterium]